MRPRHRREEREEKEGESAPNQLSRHRRSIKPSLGWSNVYLLCPFPHRLRPQLAPISIPLPPLSPAPKSDASDAKRGMDDFHGRADGRTEGEAIEANMFANLQVTIAHSTRSISSSDRRLVHSNRISSCGVETAVNPPMGVDRPCTELPTRRRSFGEEGRKRGTDWLRSDYLLTRHSQSSQSQPVGRSVSGD